ncbi:SDR family NAD(P)-dependent oxidoreductase [Geodermatophilus sp. CPCC 205506]|uniref:SDR family NAD(P)-dependent oxidoreductase n=1 Tax=Geodermatophilus sp. CPCC 205506 TaxID=2936596 RepID=UPI003EEC7E6C
MGVGQLGFHGRVVVITGAGSGLGATFAAQFASRGALVVVNDLPPGGAAAAVPANEVVSAITHSGGAAVASLHDVSTQSGATALLADAREAFGRVDAVVSNAGMLRDGDIGSLSVQDWTAVLRVNVEAHYLLTAAAWPLMSEQGGGRLVYASSGSGLFGNVGHLNYSSAKAGLTGLVRSVALEGDRLGIRSNAFAPLAATPMGKPGAGRPSSRVPARSIVGPDRFDGLMPEDVATVVMLLAHERCPVTGTVHTTAGGLVREVLIAETAGWGFPGASLEQLLENWAQVGDRGDLTFPSSLRDSLLDLVGRSQRASADG